MTDTPPAHTFVYTRAICAPLVGLDDPREDGEIGSKKEIENRTRKSDKPKRINRSEKSRSELYDPYIYDREYTERIESYPGDGVIEP